MVALNRAFLPNEPIYEAVFVKPGGAGMFGRSLRPIPSPSASVDLPLFALAVGGWGSCLLPPDS